MKPVKQLLCIYILFAPCMGETLLQAQSYVPVWNDHRMKVKPAVDIKAFAFSLDDIKLLASPFTVARDADVSYLLRIEPDRLLADFRKNAGLKAKGERYGGWESSGLAGHTLGHYLSALALQYASGRDPAILKRANYIVDQLEECQKARKSGYIGAIPGEDSMWAEVAKGNIRSKGFDLNGAWSPWYTVHKVLGGLLDAYLYCNNQKALSVSLGIADWTGNITSHLNDTLMQKMLVTEYGGMNDALVNVYALTGIKKYLDLSYRFYDRRIMDSLAAKTDVLPGKHSNTQIPKVIGSARRFQLTGDKKDNIIANFFWETITQHHSYATGGNSNYEYLSAPDQLSDKLTDNTTETCNTYNMLKLTRELFATNPSSALTDYYEKALYNHILASQNHKTGMVTYFVSLRMGGKKEYSDEYNSFTCCVGTGMENHVKYGENIYYRGKDGSLYVNLFIPSVLNWKEKGLSVRQETSLPSGDVITLKIATKKAVIFPLRIRKPNWSGKVSVRVNGLLQDVAPAKDGYIVIARKWMNNDSVECTMPMKVYAEEMPDNPNRKALFYGPVLLAGVLGEKEPEPSDIPVFVTAQTDPEKWIEQLNSDSLSFKSVLAKTTRPIRLIPFNQTGDEHYTVYWDVFTPDEWSIQEKNYEAEKMKQKELEAHTVDQLRFGEMQPERDHALSGERISAGDDHNRKWRMADEKGYLSFTMKLDPSSVNTLVLTYWGMDNRGRVFDIYVNDTAVATEDLDKYKDSRFYNIPYPIPQQITRYKLNATIKLVPREHNSAGPVYGAKMVKGDVSRLIAKDAANQ